MSATSTAERDNGAASGGRRLDLAQQEVERAGHLADRLDGDARRLGYSRLMGEGEEGTLQRLETGV